MHRDASESISDTIVSIIAAEDGLVNARWETSG